MRSTTTRNLGLLSMLGLLAFGSTPGCAVPEQSDEAVESAVSTSLESRFADLRRVNTDNLSRVVVNLGADKLNDALAIRTKYVELGITIKNLQDVLEPRSLNPLWLFKFDVDFFRAGRSDPIYQAPQPVQALAQNGRRRRCFS